MTDKLNKFNKFLVTPKGVRIRLEDITAYCITDADLLKIERGDLLAYMFSVDNTKEGMKQLDEYFGIEIDMRKYD